jgi:hypothetical protein
MLKFIAGLHPEAGVLTKRFSLYLTNLLAINTFGATICVISER